MRTEKLYQRIASLINQHSNCLAANNTEWQDKTAESLEYLAKQYLPHGSGVDCGTKIDLDASLRKLGKIILTFGFHHMDESGMYCGWTEHVATVSPDLQFGFKLAISGPNKNGIKEYLSDLLHEALNDREWSVREEYLRQVEAHPEIKITGRWIDQCRQVWDCMGIEYPSYQMAMRAALASVYPGAGIPLNQ